jgi:hypothetical protein
MNLKFRVQSHSFSAEGKTRVELTGVDGTEGNSNLVVSSAQAGKLPVGSTVAVKVGAGD